MLGWCCDGLDGSRSCRQSYDSLEAMRSRRLLPHIRPASHSGFFIRHCYPFVSLVDGISLHPTDCVLALDHRSLTSPPRSSEKKRTHNHPCPPSSLLLQHAPPLLRKLPPSPPPPTRSRPDKHKPCHPSHKPYTVSPAVHGRTAVSSADSLYMRNVYGAVTMRLGRRMGC